LIACFIQVLVRLLVGALQLVAQFVSRLIQPLLRFFLCLAPAIGIPLGAPGRH
jgi:hypothetical protein